jgi:thiamine biosynthesis protein ThiI
MHSKDIEIALATALWQQLGGDAIKLDLENADVTIGVEIREEMSMVFLETHPGPGGLPVGSNDRTLALLSGGIDSPVACWMIMKRGSQVEFVTFHSDPYTPPETLAKVSGIAALLNTFQRPARLAACNLAEMQKLIRDNCDPRLRTVLYRRMMVRIAAKVAERFKANALVTGDALGQVASQTLCNMSVINQASPLLILRPTVGMDKLETIHIAEKIGSFELSSVQVPDSCTVFAPKRPTTRADLAKVIAEEARIPDWEQLVDDIARNAEITRPGT